MLSDNRKKDEMNSKSKTKEARRQEENSYYDIKD